jgi:uncharacterized YigZ family protein
MTDRSSDSYLTLAEPCSHEIKIKASRFIALGYPVADRAEAEAILGTVRKKEHAATHHCYAWVAGLDREEYKYSDDGEPSGTAGRPIYQVITGRGLQNAMIIVVRYFGGIKLGAGGLTRAYSQAAAELLARAEIVERLICDHLRFSLPFTFYDRLMRLIGAGPYRIIAQDFGQVVAMEIEIRRSKTDLFISQLKELTGGKIDVSKTD